MLGTLIAGFLVVFLLCKTPVKLSVKALFVLIPVLAFVLIPGCDHNSRMQGLAAGVLLGAAVGSKR